MAPSTRDFVPVPPSCRPLMNQPSALTESAPAPSGATALDRLAADVGEWLRTGQFELAEQMMAAFRARQSPTPLEDARLQALEGRRLSHAGHYHSALQKLLPLVPLLETARLQDELTAVYIALGYSMGCLGNPEHGQEWVTKAILRARREGRSAELVRAEICQGILAYQSEHFEDAVLHLERALALAGDLDMRAAIHTCSLNLAQMHVAGALRAREGGAATMAAHHAARALHYGEASLQMGLTLSAHQAAMSLDNLGQALWINGQHDAALVQLAKAEATNPGDPELVGEVRMIQGLVARDQGDQDAALRLLHEAFALASEHHLLVLMSQVQLELSRLYEAQGHLAAALHWFKARHELLMAQYRERVRIAARQAELQSEADIARHARMAAEARASELQRSHRELHEQAERLARDASRDPLTGTLNRRGLDQQRAPRWDAGAPMVLALIDIDHFKRINDQFGHGVGDEVLVRLVQVIERHLPDTHDLARIGGEEFALLMWDARLDDAMSLMEQIRQALAHSRWDDLHPDLTVTLSAGVAERQAGQSFRHLQEAADVALYAAKRAGRDRIHVQHHAA